MLEKFKEILNKYYKSWSFYQSFYHDKINFIDRDGEEKYIDEMAKRKLEEDILKNISDKIKTTKSKGYTNPNLKNQQTFIPTIKYETNELFISNREELFEFLHAFNVLSEQERERILKHISPSEEYYINQLRSDRFKYILDESGENFIPQWNNIMPPNRIIYKNKII